MLVVTTVVGVFYFASNSLISNLLSVFIEAMARCDAPLLAAMPGDAQHAGYETIASAESQAAVVALIVEGVKGTGSLEHLSFRLEWSEVEQLNAMDYLVFEGGLLAHKNP